MRDKSKCDPELGIRVSNHLKSLGLETPMVNHCYTKDYQIGVISESFANIMKVLCLDLSDDSLVDTPNRFAKMLVNETMWGLKTEDFPKVTTIENKMKYDEMLIEKDITVMSNCEHHFVTIEGKAHIAYVPNGKVIGLSKLNRIVEYFSRRPQVQERLTMQILETLKYILGTEDVAVVINAKHYCVISRGVGDQSSYTLSSALSGAFKTDEKLRSELMSLVK